jgi:hypothetical protein
MTSAVTIVGAMFIVAVPCVLGAAPKIGVAVARSRWTPVAWLLVVVAALTGYVLRSRGLLVDQGDFVAFLSPLFQLSLYTLLLSGFIATFRDPPRYAPILLPGGYLKIARSLLNGGSTDWGVEFRESYVRDSLFKAVVILSGVAPPLYYMFGGAVI